MEIQSGFVFPFLLPVGMVGIFGVPALALLADRPDLAYGLGGLMGLAMAGYGVYVLHTTPSDH